MNPFRKISVNLGLIVLLVSIQASAGPFSFLKEIFGPSNGSTAAQVPDGPNGVFTPVPGPPANSPYVVHPTPIPAAAYGSDTEVILITADDNERIDKHTVCRIVHNDPPQEGGRRRDTVFVPTATAEEWAAFRNGDAASMGNNVRGLPRGVTHEECPPTPPVPPPGASCGPQMSEAMIAAAIGYDIQANLTPMSPRPGNRPRYNADPATMNALCAAMGCGPYIWRAARGWSSPSDNTLVNWNGTGWEKRPGSQEYNGVHLSASNGLILQCGVPPTPPPTPTPAATPTPTATPSPSPTPSPTP